jgi:hypothetical protein
LSAREAAGERRVAITGGAATVNQRLVDPAELNCSIVHGVFGRGQR